MTVLLISIMLCWEERRLRMVETQQTSGLNQTKLDHTRLVHVLHAVQRTVGRARGSRVRKVYGLI